MNMGKDSSLKIDGIQRFGNSNLEFSMDSLGRTIQVVIGDYRIHFTIPAMDSSLPEWARTSVHSWFRDNQPKEKHGIVDQYVQNEAAKSSDPLMERLFHLPVSREHAERIANRMPNRSLSVRNDAGFVFIGSKKPISNISKIHFRAEKMTDPAVAESFDDIYKLLDDWVVNFYQWVLLSTTNSLQALIKPRAWYEESGVPKEAMLGPSGLYGASNHFRQGKALTAELFEWCAMKAAEAPPANAWQYIREARVLLARGEYRLAVIDSCTAAELALTHTIDKRLEPLTDTSSPLSSIPVRDALLERSRGVWQLRLLVKDLGCDESAGGRKLLNQISDRIAAPRNRASHEGITIESGVALDVLRIATDVVSAVYPQLDDLP